LDQRAEEIEGLQERLEAATAAREKASTDLREAERALRAQADRTSRLEANLRAEQLSTARAPLMPELEASLETIGFGILAPKNVVIRLRKVGAGNAVRVAVLVSLNPRGQVGLPRPVGYIQVLAPGQVQDVRVGNMSELGKYQSLRCQVNYESQFGPRPPVDLTWTLS